MGPTLQGLLSPCHARLSRTRRATPRPAARKPTPRHTPPRRTTPRRARERRPSPPDAPHPHPPAPTRTPHTRAHSYPAPVLLAPRSSCYASHEMQNEAPLLWHPLFKLWIVPEAATPLRPLATPTHTPVFLHGTPPHATPHATPPDGGRGRGGPPSRAHDPHPRPHPRMPTHTPHPTAPHAIRRLQKRDCLPPVSASFTDDGRNRNNRTHQQQKMKYLLHCSESSEGQPFQRYRPSNAKKRCLQRVPIAYSSIMRRSDN